MTGNLSYSIFQGQETFDKKDWTFLGVNTRQLTHCYHDYPARMIPQIARKLLTLYASSNAGVLFDPFCGTGTSLVEGSLKGFNCIGADLNPLARLIATAKTTIPNIDVLNKSISKFNKYILMKPLNSYEEVHHINGIHNLLFWFKSEVIVALNCIKAFISEIEDEKVKLFFQAAFSETVRESSNTRNGEFKLFRYEAKKLELFNPKVFEIMQVKLARNKKGLIDYINEISKNQKNTKVFICDFNSAENIPNNILPPKSVDIVITSPPYGDSRTTVAYGQYSRFSAAWLDLFEPDKIDKKLMGGVLAKNVRDFPSKELNLAIKTIYEIDKKRALEVVGFYNDLYKSTVNVSKTIKKEGYACYVVANRKVKGVVLPTDKALRSFFLEQGFKHIETHTRIIPNKRMPLKNSPSNIPGTIDNTMSNEYIVVVKKIKSHDR